LSAASVVATPLPDEDRRALGRLHPSFMGGEYLPDRRDTEVEIARINIDSTTSDVTSVHAKAGKNRICYRIVSQANGAALPASIVCLSRQLYRNNEQIHTRTLELSGSINREAINLSA
jgi:hypothetical protein